jgi:hypothetical protein
MRHGTTLMSTRSSQRHAVRLATAAAMPNTGYGEKMNIRVIYRRTEQTTVMPNVKPIRYVIPCHVTALPRRETFASLTPLRRHHDESMAMR